MAKLSQSNIGPRDNVIINGDFNFWQRGTSFAPILNTEYCADRFFYGEVGTMVHTIIRDTDVPTEVQSGHTSNYSLKLDCTTADASIAAGDVCVMEYKVEGYDQTPLMGNYGTLSFWVKGTKTGTHCVAFISGDNLASYVAEYTISQTDTWEKKTITVLFNDTVGTWNTTNGVAMTVTWATACGSNFQTTADAWQSGLYFATSNQVNACDNTANNFRLSQVKLEVGTRATQFKPRMHGDELALCQRYYERQTTLGAWRIFGTGGQISTTQSEVYSPFLNPKRSDSITASMPTVSNFLIQSAGPSTAVTSVSSAQSTHHGCFWKLNHAAIGAASQYAVLRDNNTASAYVDYDCEL
jgi:hypothetical protein